ncbi:MAG: hypothetical protein RMM58_01440 [Chloroflexota bacterium]|nr:hypothetical protein [Dehalococcoidia bacterium]MDW8252523.1 hypothetical protein [Chloroflexota bacterium]
MTAIIPFIRDDIFGNDVVEPFGRAFGAAGGTVAPALRSVRWFGADGTAEALALVDNPRAAQFAATD